MTTLHQKNHCRKCGLPRPLSYDMGTDSMLCNDCWFRSEPKRRKDEAIEPGEFYQRRRPRKKGE